MFKHALPRLSLSLLVLAGLVGPQIGAEARRSADADSLSSALPATSVGALRLQNGHRTHPHGVVSPQDKSQADFLFGSAQDLMWTDPKSALVQIDAAMRLNPKGGYGYQGLQAQCLARTGRIEEALTAMRAAVKRDPTDYSLLELYNILRDANRMPEAVKSIKKSHKERNVPGLYIMALQFLQEKDRLKEGMPLAEMAITGVEKKGNPFPFDVTAAYTFKGDILMLKGKSKEARALWQKVIDLPMKADYWMKLAQAHLAG
jgi:tetratricopeptide (TPR) repeat protein